MPEFKCQPTCTNKLGFMDSYKCFAVHAHTEDKFFMQVRVVRWLTALKQHLKYVIHLTRPCL